MPLVVVRLPMEQGRAAAPMRLSRRVAGVTGVIMVVIVDVDVLVLQRRLDVFLTRC